jgi:hypothetical protein
MGLTYVDGLAELYLTLLLTTMLQKATENLLSDIKNDAPFLTSSSIPMQQAVVMDKVLCSFVLLQA